MDLIYAIEKKDEIAAIAALNEANKNHVDFYGTPAVVHAANAGMTNLVRAMIEEKSDFSASAAGTGWNALHAAVEKGHAALIPVLVNDANIPVNSLTAKGDSALSLAEDDATKKTLLANGAHYVTGHRKIGDVAARWMESLDMMQTPQKCAR